MTDDVGDSSIVRLGAPVERDDRYDVLATVASNRTGQVWRVEDRQEGLVLAMRVASSTSRGATARIEREAAVLERLGHPNIVAFFGRGRREDGTAYYTMEYVDGPTLEHAIRRCRSWAERSMLVPLVRDACRAIGHAHRTKVVHGNLHPSNVILGEYGPGTRRAVVIGWGRARDVLEPDAAESTDPDGPATVIESVRRDPRDVRTDVCALGAILYDIATGRPAFPRRRQSPRASDVPGTDPDLARIVDRALGLRGRGHSSADALAEDLEAWLECEVSVVRFPAPPRSLLPAYAGVVGALVLLALVVAVGVACATVLVVSEAATGETTILDDAPNPTPQPVPVPVQPQEAEDAPEPVPRRPVPPPEPSVGEVLVEGIAPADVTLRCQGRLYSPGPVPVGTCSLAVRLGPDATYSGALSVGAGASVIVRCDPVFRWCAADGLVPTEPTRLLGVVLESGGWAYVTIDDGAPRLAPFAPTPVGAGVHRIRVDNPVTGLHYEAERSVAPGEQLTITVPAEAR